MSSNGNALGIRPESVSNVALQSMAREATEAKAMVESARAFPRNQSQAFLNLLESCKRPSFAEGASYEFPRGGQKVSGPAVGLAREAARCWGNVTYGIRIVSTEGDEIHLQGWAWDLETNARVVVEDKFKALVQRKVKDTKGKPTGEVAWVTPDERDLRELVNRRGAICERNAILKVLPRDLVDDALYQAACTLQQDAEEALKSNRSVAVKHVVVNFDQLGVTPAMLEQRLGHPLQNVTAEELAELRTIYRSLRDKQTKVSDHFEVAGDRGAAQQAADLEAKIKGRGKAKDEPKAEEPEAEGEPAEVEAETVAAFAVCPACEGTGEGVDGACGNCEGSGEVAL